MWTVGGARLTLGACLLLSACTATADASTPVPPKPASSAGGACHLLDYGRIGDLVGLDFVVAGSAKRDRTSTCVLRTAEAALPELSLSVTPSSADVAVFKDTVLPRNAKLVPGLGRVAYQKGLEIGWLAGNARLITLKVSLPKGADLATMEPKLPDLAKEIDKSSL